MGARVAPPPTQRRSRFRPVFGLTVVVLLAVLGTSAWLTWRDTGSSTNLAESATSLPDRTVEAGPVTVKVQLRQLDAVGAVFKITFDTHSVQLDQDLSRAARLVVGATVWPVASWSGDGTGGHHREGELRFTPAGPVTGSATLTIDGLPALVTATWDVASR